MRFLLNLSPPKGRPTQPWEDEARVQQLEVWTPGELEMALFGIYSPVHAMLWMATTTANWMLMFFVMFIVGAQVRFLLNVLLRVTHRSTGLLFVVPRNGAFVRRVAQGPFNYFCGSFARV